MISKTRLREFWETHNGTEKSLHSWHQIVSQTRWTNFAELRSTFPSADMVGRLTVFNIKGNNLRLITRVEFGKQAVYIRTVCTHSEYDRNDWKKDSWF